MKNKALSVIIGLLAIAAGVGYALEALEIIESFTIFFDGWWTLFLIVPGLTSLFSDKSNKGFAIFITSLGVVLLLQQQGILNMSFKHLILPALLILFGLSLIIGVIVSSFRKKNRLVPMTPSGEPAPEYSVSFGTVKPNFDGKVFEGCSIDMTFGAGKLDLSKSTIMNEVTIYINSAFSSVKIIFPAGCRVDAQTSTFLAGVSNKYVSSPAPNAPNVHIYAAVSLGFVDIR